MILTIEISDDDIRTLMNMSMTVEDMEETMEGRIACAICRSVNKEASTDTNKKSSFNESISRGIKLCKEAMEEIKVLKERLEDE